MKTKPITDGCSPDEAAGLRIPELRRVLVPTDLSAWSNRAVVYACAMLRGGGTMCLVHVEQPFEFANPIHAPHPAAMRRLEEERARQRESCRQRLRALIPPEAESRGIRTEVEVLREDNPAAAICRAAETFGADLICMASHGHSGITKAVLGSVAQAVLTRSRLPVLLCRPDMETETQPGEPR